MEGPLQIIHIFHIKCNMDALFCNLLFLGCLSWLSGGGGGTVAAIKCIHWQPGLTLPGGFLVHWVFLHYQGSFWSGGKCRMAYITIAGGLVVAKPF